MNRRSFAFSLPAAAGLLIGCSTRSKSTISLTDSALQESLRNLEASIGGLEMGLNTIRDSSCGEVATALGGTAASIRSSFNDLKVTLGSPNL